MSRVKDIRVKVIDSKTGNGFVKQQHYSGKVVQNSSLHFGAFLDGILHGVMSFGSPLDKRKVLPLVITREGKICEWNAMLELNRMAFDHVLPRNSESRCISIAIKLIKKSAKHIKWLLSFADGCQCGDGAIYRASGFLLTAVKENNRLIRFNDGYITHGINLCHRGSPKISKLYNPKNLTESALYKAGAFVYIKGYQLRYIYLIDKTCRLTVAELPFSKIAERGAGMYLGEKIERGSRNSTASSSLEGEVC